MDEKLLTEKIDSLGDLDDQQRRNIACSLIGHSRIQTTCMGYFYCARCGDQLGDTLASIYPGAEKAVIVGHKCQTCEENYAECTWEDKFMCQDPFTEEVI